MKKIYTLSSGGKIDANEIVSITKVYEYVGMDIIMPQNWFMFDITLRNKKEISVRSDYFKTGRFSSKAKDPIKKEAIKKELTKEYNKLVKVWESL